MKRFRCTHCIFMTDYRHLIREHIKNNHKFRGKGLYSHYKDEERVEKDAKR